MIPPNTCGMRLRCLLFLCCALGIWKPSLALGQNYPKEYIIAQPVSVAAPSVNPSAVSFEVEYAYGQDITDNDSVVWYKDGKLLKVTTPILQTYNVGGTVITTKYDPYANGGKGVLYDGSNPTAGTPGPAARAVWIATLTISAPTDTDVGIYYAKIGASNLKYWTYTNFAQLGFFTTDPAVPFSIVAQPKPLSKSRYDSGLLWTDPQNHVLGLLHTPFGTATDSDGFTFIADTLNHVIRRVSPGGHLTTLAGMDGQPFIDIEPSEFEPTHALARTRKERDPVSGYRDGVSNQTIDPSDATLYRNLSSYSTSITEPLFNHPEGIAVSDTGVVYVADTGNNAIRKIQTIAKVTTVSTLYGNPFLPDLNSPRGVAFTGSLADPINDPPALYVVDSGNYSIKKLYLDANGNLDTSKGTQGMDAIAGKDLTPGWQGVTVTGLDTRFYSPRGIVVMKDQQTYFQGSWTLGGNVVTAKSVAGLAVGMSVAGSGVSFGTTITAVNAAASTVTLSKPLSIKGDLVTLTASKESLFIADTVNHVIRRVRQLNGVWTADTVVGFVGAKGNVNGTGAAARLSFPIGLTLDPDNQFLYFTEFGSHSLRRVVLPSSPQISGTRVPWKVELVAGSASGAYGPQDGTTGEGTGTAAAFHYPAGISFNRTDGSILLADSNNNVIRKVTIPSAGANAWMGASTTRVGAVGVAGNRDFANITEYTYQWLKDGLELTDSASTLPQETVSLRAGSTTDALSITNLQFDDSGVYAVRIKNLFDVERESNQASVYVATGDRPVFQAPGYHFLDSANNELSSFKQGDDVFISADVLPADEVTYQWQVAEDLPDALGNYVWLNLSDNPISIQVVNNPGLAALLGSSGTSISGSVTPRLGIKGFQKALNAAPPYGVLPNLRFRVQAYTKEVSPQPLSTSLVASFAGYWSANSNIVSVETTAGFSVGMTVVGSDIPLGTTATIVALSETPTPNLTLSYTFPTEGNGAVLSAVLDISTGKAVKPQFGVLLRDPTLSYSVGGGAATIAPVSGLAINVLPGDNLVLSLASGTSASISNPAPTYQWSRKDTAAGPATPISGQTGTSLALTSIKDADGGYYFVTVDNGLGSQTSNSVFVDVQRPPSLIIKDLSTDSGTATPNDDTKANGSTVERVVDQTKPGALTLLANLDASSQASFEWIFRPDGSGTDQPLADGQSIAGIGTVAITADRTFAQLVINGVSDDAVGTFRITASVSGITKTAAWHVTVKYPPRFISKSFALNGNEVSSPQTLDLNGVNIASLGATFKSPTSMPLKYKWRRNRTVLAESTNTLILPGIAKQDLGVYRLEVTNDMGTVILGPVSGTEVAVPNQTGWQIFASGTPSIVTQPVVKGVGSIAPAISSSSSAASASVRASAGLGTVQHAAVGQKVALQVTVEANPPPTYQWYLGGAPITGAKSAIYFVPTITANVGSQFIYSVSATNGSRPQDTVQSDSVMIRVDALPDPVVTTLPALKTGQTQYANGADITLMANVSDNQALYSYQWKKGGVPIFGATGPSLLLAKAGSEQSGSYSVVVTGVSMARESVVKSVSIAKPALSKPDVLYPVTFQNTSSVRGFMCNPALTVLAKPSDASVPYTYGATAGTRISLNGVAPTGQYLQGWQVKDASGNVLTTLAPRAGTFIMPSQPVFITPTVTRPYSGTYSGLLSLEAPWQVSESGSEWGSGDSAAPFRDSALEVGAQNIRGYFSCTVSSLGTVSGKIQYENRAFSFTCALDGNLQGTFRINTTYNGMPWALNGTIRFNSTADNQAVGYLDNVMHLTLTDVLLNAPPVISAGQTLYGAGAGTFGAVLAAKTDISEALGSPFSGTNLVYTGAVYREINGETKAATLGLGGVFSFISAPSGYTMVSGYLGNGTKVTFAGSMGGAYAPSPTTLPLFGPVSTTLSGQAAEAFQEALTLRTASLTIPLWFKGDSATEPVYGAVVTSGPTLYGCLGALSKSTSIANASDYIGNGIGGYYFDPTATSSSARVAPFTSTSLQVLTTSDSYPATTASTSLATLGGAGALFTAFPVNGNVSNFTLTLDNTTGLVLGSMLEKTSRYVDTQVPYSPAYAASKSLLACRVCGVVIQGGSIGQAGAAGFLYRGTASPVEPLKNVLGIGSVESANLKSISTSRTEALSISVTEPN